MQNGHAGVPVICVHPRLSAVIFVLDSPGVLGGSIDLFWSSPCLGGSIIVLDFLGVLAVRY
jgi:hypothetical protein